MATTFHPAPQLAFPLPALASRAAPEVYRRRRAVVSGAFGVLVALAAWFGSAQLPGAAGPSAGDARPVVTERYLVQPGDSLWSIAESLRPGADPRPVVDALAAANGGATLVAGQVLVVDLAP